MLIQTPRLSIRRLGTGDEPFLLELLNQSSFIRNIGDRNVRTLEDATQYIVKGPAASYEKFGFGLFHVEIKGSGIAIGICGLLKRDYLPDVDIGFAYLEPYWGQGYALEAAEAVMEFGWTKVGLKRIVAITAPHNANSIRLLGKIGMQFEAVFQPPGSTSESNLYGRSAPTGGRAAGVL
jgi:ribosomal-protein-alanine N-acetyltransferase